MAMTFSSGRLDCGDAPARQVVYATGRRLLHVAWVDTPVRVVEVPRADGERRMGPALNGDGSPCSTERAARQVLATGRARGITHRAERLLQAAAGLAETDEEELVQMENNPENPAPAGAQAPAAATTKEKTVSTTAEHVAQATRPPAKKAGGKPAAKKQAKKPAAKKAAKANGGERAKRLAPGPKGPRPSTINAAIVELTKAGKEKKAIAAAVAKQFPGTSFSKLHAEDPDDVSTVSWYQWNARRHGWLPKLSAADKAKRAPQARKSPAKKK